MQQAPGSTFTLTVHVDQDVGPTPYWIELFDASTGTFLHACSIGTSCSIDVTQTSSSIETWVTLQLTATRTGPWLDLTAVSSLNVGTTPYCIEIFGWTDNSMPWAAVICSAGTVCDGTIPFPSPITFPEPAWFMAVICYYSQTWYPSGLRAESQRLSA